MSNPDITPQVDPASLVEDWNAGLVEGLTYMLDSMHFPHPLAPLTMDLLTTVWAAGSMSGFQGLGLPMLGWHIVGRNHYRFEVQEFANVFDEAAIEATMRREMASLRERWTNEHLPALRVDLRRLEGLTSQVATADDLNPLIDEALAAFQDMWRIHFSLVQAMGLAMQVFDEFHLDLFGGSPEDGHVLLAGQLTESVKATFGLSDLAKRAQDLGVAGTILDHDVESVVDALTATEAGRLFLADLYDYLDTYGLRQDLFDLAVPTWRERPAYALTNVRNHLKKGLDARVHHVAIQAAAEEAKARARVALSTYPEPVRGQFEALLAMGEAGSFLQEEHNFYIDQVGSAWTRLFFLAIGSRLVEGGSIGVPDDVFFLTVDQIRSAITEPTPDWRAVVERQRQSVERAKSITPPPFIGTPPAGPPPAETPIQRSLIRFFGAPPQPSDDPDRVMGNPGARGIATGPARVVRTLEEASALEPGEILVTITTMPPWSPLFAVAAGVVTETGGPLSHCAIVAREYGLPAVVGAAGAMQRIANGQVISIDGSTGIVDLRA